MIGFVFYFKLFYGEMNIKNAVIILLEKRVFRVWVWASLEAIDSKNWFMEK